MKSDSARKRIINKLKQTRGLRSVDVELDTVLKIIENLNFNMAHRFIRHTINVICLASAKYFSYRCIGGC